MYDTTLYIIFFFFNDTATTEIYTLSLHDALPISGVGEGVLKRFQVAPLRMIAKRFLDVRDPLFGTVCGAGAFGDRKSTRLNSSHLVISYAVFCLKKKKVYFFVRMWMFYLYNHLTI